MHINCPVSDWQPGQTLLLVVGITFKPDPYYPSWAQEDEPLYWGAGIAQPGPQQYNFSNSSSGVGYVFCSKRSTLPGCKTAIPGNSSTPTQIFEGTCPPGATCGGSSTTSTTTPSGPAQEDGFGLVGRLTQVQNTHRGELTIDAAHDTAVLNHTGKYGGAGNGGNWKVAYSWKLPPRLVAGKPEAITLGAVASDVSPRQELTFSMVALAPDFSKQLTFSYPTKASASQRYQFTLASDEAGTKDIAVTIEFESSQVTYHYRS